MPAQRPNIPPSRDLPAEAVSRRAEHRPSLRFDAPSFWERHPEFNAPAFLTPDEKRALANSGRVVTVRSVRRSAGKFGPVWWIGLDIEGKVYTFTMDAAEYREEMLTAMQEFVRHNLEGIPVIVTLDYTASGNEVFSLRNPEQGEPDQGEPTVSPF